MNCHLHIDKGNLHNHSSTLNSTMNHRRMTTDTHHQLYMNRCLKDLACPTVTEKVLKGVSNSKPQKKKFFRGSSRSNSHAIKVVQNVKLSEKQVKQVIVDPVDLSNQTNVSQTLTAKQRFFYICTTFVLGLINSVHAYDEAPCFMPYNWWPVDEDQFYQDYKGNNTCRGFLKVREMELIKELNLLIAIMKLQSIVPMRSDRLNKIMKILKQD